MASMYNYSFVFQLKVATFEWSVMQIFVQDFATSSLHGEVARENQEEIGDSDDQTIQYAIDERKRWEQR